MINSLVQLVQSINKGEGGGGPFVVVPVGLGCYKEGRKERKSALLQTTKKLSAAISRKEEKMYKQECCTRAASTEEQACKLKLRLRELTSCLCSAAASAVCFDGHYLAGLNTTETGNELS